MSYEKQTWNKYDELKTEEENIENGAVVTDNRMNHIEEGIESNDKANSSQSQSMNKHIADTANPHKVTATQVGAYSKDESDQKLATQKQTIDSHVNNKFNPHAVTASQVGAYTKTETDAKFATSQSLTDLSNKVVVDKGNITSVTDLNSLTSKGFYRIGGLVGGTDVLNVPSELSGLNFYAFLTVTGALQELTVYAPRKDTTWTYSRSLSGNPAAWSPWSKTVMADDSGKVTVTRIETTSDVRTWVSLTLSNAGTAVLRYKTINGAVYLCGEGNWGSFTAGQSKTVCTLPPELRPDVTCNYVITTQNGSGQPMELQVQTGGNVNLWSGLASGGRYGGFVGNYPLP